MQNENYELISLNNVLKIINDKLKYYRTTRKNYLGKVLKTQRDMWEEVKITNQNNFDVDALQRSTSFQNRINFEGQKVIDSNRLNSILIKMKDSPYFAKINFLEKGEYETEQIYIGISTLTDEKGEIVIYDWRAPISSMFYDYEIGFAKYICPNCEVEGEIKLKRQFKIKQGKLIYMFDTDINIDDEILKEVLSKNVNTKMKNIVASIQREQNAAIRDEQNKLLVVQGPAGCGKTSIALHRVAYLLYRYRNKIKSNNIVIFTPNRIFNDYINDVLPELGEQNVNIMTFSEYTEPVFLDEKFLHLDTFNNQMEYILDNHGEYNNIVESIKYKTTKDFKMVLDKYLEYLDNSAFIFKELKYRDKVIITSEEILKLFHDDYNYLPIMKKLKKIKNRIEYLVKPIKDARYEQLKIEIFEERTDIINEEELQEVALERLNEEFYEIDKEINNCTNFNVIDLYINLFNDNELLDSLSNKNVYNFDEMSKFTVENIKRGHIFYEDVNAILYLQASLGNIAVKDSIKHVVIDEVQDYSLLQIAFLKQLFPNSKFTLVGDFNQSINPYMVDNKVENIIKEFNIKNSQVVNLNKTYRSTKEITNFAKSILSENNSIFNVDRKGDEPKLIKVKSLDDLNKTIINSIIYYQNKGYKSIAVICKNNEICNELFETVKTKVNVKLVSDKDEAFQNGVVILPSYLSKGLEFDVVLLYDGNDVNYSIENQRKLFYTICTRALHVLNVYYTGRLTPFIKDKFIN